MKSCFYFSLFPCGEEIWEGWRDLARGRAKMAGAGELPAGDLFWKLQMVPEGAGCPQGFPPLAATAFPDSSHCSEARCKDSCSRILPPSPSQVRKKPWVRGAEGLQAGEGLPLCQARCAAESLFSFLSFFFEVKTTHEASPSPTQSPSIIPRPFGGGCHGDHKQNGMQINTARTTAEDGPRE